MRKNLLIYPQFQLLLIVVNSGLIIAGFVLNWIQISRTLARFTELGKAVHLQPDHDYFRLITFQTASLHSNLILSFFATLVLSATSILILSHRLAGPIVRLKSYLSEIAKTRKVSNKLQFRKNDFFTDIPDVVNEALEALKS